MLTPQEVAEHGFSKARVGGYNMKEVDDFLDQVTADYTALYKESSILKGKIKVLAEKISEYRETEEAMRTTLLAAQKMANSMIVKAEEKKNQMLADAEREGLRRKEQLEQEIAEAEGKMAAAQVATQQYIETAREQVRQQETFLAQLPALKPEAVKAAMLKVGKLKTEPLRQEATQKPAVEAATAETTAPENAETEETAAAVKPEAAAEQAVAAGAAVDGGAPEAADSIEQILQEEEETNSQQEAAPGPRQDPAQDAMEFAEELAAVAMQGESEHTAHRIDFGNLKFGKDYEIQ